MPCWAERRNSFTCNLALGVVCPEGQADSGVVREDLHGVILRQGQQLSLGGIAGQDAPVRVGQSAVFHRSPDGKGALGDRGSLLSLVGKQRQGHSAVVPHGHGAASPLGPIGGGGQDQSGAGAKGGDTAVAVHRSYLGIHALPDYACAGGSVRAVRISCSPGRAVHWVWIQGQGGRGRLALGEIGGEGSPGRLQASGRWW